MKSKDQVEEALLVMSLAASSSAHGKLPIEQQSSSKAIIDVLNWVLDEPNHFGEKVIDPSIKEINRLSKEGTITE
jgi:hypothetical protein